MPRKKTNEQPAETAPEEMPPADTAAAEAAAETTADTATEPAAEDAADSNNAGEPAPGGAADDAPADPAAPEPWNSPEIMELQLNWNEKTETREIGMPLSKEELSEAANLLADTVTKIRELEVSKKASADHFKGLIVDQEEIQNSQSRLIRRGTAPKPVPCRWLFQVSGRDDTGRFIRDDNSKTLIRLDSGEVLGVKLITTEERQMALPLEEQPAPEVESVDEDDFQDEFFTATDTDPDRDEKDPDSAGQQENGEADPAFEAGAQARRDGTDIADNPHPDGSDESFAWDRGWAKADREEPAACA